MRVSVDVVNERVGLTPIIINQVLHGRTMQAATSLTFLVFTVILFRVSSSIQAQPTIPPASNFPGPCRAWVFPCDKGSWICTTEAAYWGFIYGPQPDCPAVHPQTQAPPPGECQLVNGMCQFTNSMLKCKAWTDPPNGNKCDSVAAYGSLKKYGMIQDFGPCPPPNQLCLAINNTCQWYDPCISWKGHCMSGYICGSADEYYAFLYGPQPPCPEPPPGWVPPDPPGQCAIRKDRCDWYECASWLSWCDSYWLCGTVYDKEIYEAGPPPPCPPPPPDGHHTHPPVQPGTCRFNISAGKCNFFPNTTCSAGKVYESCGTACPKTCDNESHPCTSQCVPGCFCPSGTVEHNGQCIDPRLCPAETKCVSWIGWCGSWSCGTVKEKEISMNIPPPPCPLPPKPPVQPGTCQFNSSAGRCSFFPNTTCSEGKVYESCGTVCPKTCDNFSHPCSSQCEPGCFCPSGTVEHNGQCISPTLCPIKKNDTNPCNQPIYPPGYKPSCAMLEGQWTFDTTIGQCIPFAYSPCGEDREGYDVFVTQEECIKTCMHQDPCKQPIYPPGFVPRCNILQEQWTYNSTTGQCLEFYYHPCGEDRDGYDVFDTEEECTKTCIHQDPCKQSIYPPGYIPNCNVLQKQWTYNQTSKQCVKFDYHPCGEDRDGYDVFATELECVKTCVQQDPCNKPIYPPDFKISCNVLIKQWTYNPVKGQCVEFEYHPCGQDRDGYDVFATELECNHACVPQDGKKH